MGGLTTALLFKDEVPAAREAMTTAVPLILGYDLGFRFADAAALLAVLEDRTEATAKMLGYCDVANAAHNRVRKLNEVTARDMVMRRLTATENPANVEQGIREGALLSDSEAYRQVLMVAAA